MPAPADVKEEVMEAEPSGQKRKRPTAGLAPDAGATQKTSGKPSEKKRRRSQAAEASEGEVPSKMRKTSGSEGGWTDGTERSECVLRCSHRSETRI